MTTEAEVAAWLADPANADARKRVLRAHWPSTATWRGEYGESRVNHDYAQALIVYWDLTRRQKMTHAQAVKAVVESRPAIKKREAQFGNIANGKAKRADIHRLALLIRDGPKI